MMWLRAPVVVRMVVAILVLLPLLLTGARGQQQRFRVRPSNVSAVAGHTALLRCEVQHQTGQLQWAKDGFALGYSRSLPGYNRYRMVGDPGSGVHDLEISNVTLEDDGRFQCQVSPNRGQAAIKADAFLTVLVGPSSISTSSTARLLGTGRYEVSRLRQLTIKCDVTGSRPAATVQWQRNGVTVPLDAKESAAEWGHPVRHDTTSVVQLRPTAEDDGAAYSCVAQHPALGNANKALNSTIHLSVLYPPGAPRISGFRSGDVIRLGEQRTLTCSSSGGNPPAQLRWLKNGHPLSSKTRRLPGQTVSELRFRAQRSDLHAEYRCEASSPVQPLPASTTVTVTVQFGPDTVTVTGTPSARGGERVQMHCTTAGSSPAANITWVVNGRTIMNTTQESEDDPLGGQVSRSNLTVTVPEGTEEDVTAACYALNPALGVTKVGTRKITVLHPPRRPTILGYEPGTYLRAGERVSLSCIAQGGNPPATLTWYRAGLKVTDRSRVQDGLSRSVLSFRVERADNGRRYTCSSNSTSFGEPQSATVTLGVHYPPSTLETSVHPAALRAGGGASATLTCQSRPSLPPADLTWWRGDAKVTDGVGQLETFPAGNYGGSASRLVLRKTLSWEDDGATYTCRSHVPDVESGSLLTNTTLHVNHAPVFSEPFFTEEVLLGSSHVLNFSAAARPGPPQYQWFREPPLDGSSTAVTLQGPLLKLQNVTQKDGGWYYLQATNAEGNTTTRINVDVQYAPRVAGVSAVSLVAPGEDGVLQCSFDGNPLPTDAIRWRREGFGLHSTRVTTYSRNGTSYLTVRGVTTEDSGVFTCVAENGIGRTTAAATLLVKHAPVVVQGTAFGRVAAAGGSTGRLPCRAEGAPNVTFSWSSHRGAIREDASGGKYRIDYSQVDLVTWQSVLYISNISAADYATYRCTCRNTLGADVLSLTLQRPSAPLPPLALTAHNRTDRSIVVTWTAGYDGGLPQTFGVRYVETEDATAPFQYISGLPGNTTHYSISSLESDTAYRLEVKAYNRLGESSYSLPLRTRTREDTSRSGALALGEGRLPQYIIIVISGVGGLLLLVNVALAVFFVRRRARLVKQARLNSSDDSTDGCSKSEPLRIYSSETLRALSTKPNGEFSRSNSLADLTLDTTASDYKRFLSSASIETTTNHLLPMTSQNGALTSHNGVTTSPQRGDLNTDQFWQHTPIGSCERSRVAVVTPRSTFPLAEPVPYLSYPSLERVPGVRRHPGPRAAAPLRAATSAAAIWPTAGTATEEMGICREPPSPTPVAITAPSTVAGVPVPMPHQMTYIPYQTQTELPSTCSSEQLCATAGRLVERGVVNDSTGGAAEHLFQGRFADVAAGIAPSTRAIDGAGVALNVNCVANYASPPSRVLPVRSER